jgi:hypothetical protein
MASKSKRIWLDGIELTYANKAEAEPEIKTDVIKTFSGNITDGDDKPSWKVSIDTIRYNGTVKGYVEIREKIYEMMRNPATIKIKEVSTLPSETLTVSELFYNCILDNKKVTFDVETRTIENLSFVATKKREWINGTEIKVN